MKHLNLLFPILVLLSTFNPNRALPQSKYTGQSIEQILTMPDDSINIGLADLVLAKDFYPDLKIESFLYAFDYMAHRFNYYFGQYTDPDRRIRALNTFIYRKGYWNDSVSFHYDDSDLHVTKLSNKFINGYIATRKGSCITMPMLYVILGERLGFPIFASRLPYHFFVRYIPEQESPRFHENIEATNGGSYVSDKRYRKDLLAPDKAIKNGVYLRTLTKRQYIATLLLINSNEWIVRRNLDKARCYLELSMKYDSTFSSAYMNYAAIHLAEAMMLERNMNEEAEEEMAFYTVYAKNRNRNQSAPAYRPANLPQQTLEIPEPDSPAFQIHILDNLSKMDNRRRPDSPPQVSPPRQQCPVDPDLSVSLAQITMKYVPQIKAKLAVYKKYKRKAEDLGIVREYPLLFFQTQSVSLRKVQERGVK